MSIESYQVGVNLFANAERITGPIGEMISALERLLQAQKSAQSGFNDMTSALGGARRLARGMADDMERAARAAQNVASASSRFRPGGSSGGGASSGGSSSTPPVMPPIPPTQPWSSAREYGRHQGQCRKGDPGQSIPDCPRIGTDCAGCF